MTAGAGFVVRDEVVGLRYFELADVDDVTAACQDPEIIRWTATIPSPYTSAHARGWIERHEQWRRQGSAVHFAIVDPVDGKLSGAISLDSLQRPPIQVGYWVAGWARDRGFASHALRLVSSWGFETLRCEAITLVTKVGNERSERVAANGDYRFVERVVDYQPANATETFTVKLWTRRRPTSDPRDDSVA
jgi:RimJ/RimL family protein N-acetyltransferase